MNQEDILRWIQNGENSGMEFKRDDIRPEQLAKEIVAFLNFKGGKILLGVEDDGTLSGITRPALEEWVINICSDMLHPGIIPYYEEIQMGEKRIAVISVDMGISKPYVMRHDQGENIYIRVGSTSRLASREEHIHLLQIGVNTLSDENRSLDVEEEDAISDEDSGAAAIE
ncbi:AlbA family DNA-binding domain-containing protein [Desulfonema magnum]|uniref:Schlafen AAA domain-containing protein n=1 Tax=Desulfonema magnum TaxID=45655 RepID=A0A975BUB4_9BACT|nr:ATP-binding protein [Desulfonema magnum]QTA91970.1 Schlafen AAA domain-containing protein [Desulfonema magnum]